MKRLSLVCAIIVAMAGGLWFVNRPEAPTQGPIAHVIPAADTSPPAVEPASPVPSSRTTAIAPIPFKNEAPPESVPTHPASARSTVIKDPHGKPLAKAQVTRWRRETALAASRTDSQGTFDWQDADLTAVVPANAPTFRFTPNECAPTDDPARTMLALPRRSAVAGRVTSTHQPLPETELQLRGDPRFAEVDLTGRGGPARTPPRRALTTRTNADGTFEFYGLPPDFSGVLKVGIADSAFTIEHPRGVARTVTITAPIDDLVVDVDTAAETFDRSAHFAGRVVDEAAHGVRDAAIVATLKLTDGSAQVESGRSADDGRFSIPMPASGCAGAELEIRDANGQVVRTLAIPGPIGPGRILDDIVISSVRSLTVHVQDSAARPIPRAFVIRPERRAEYQHVVCDAAGTCTVTTSTYGALALVAGAPGFETRELHPVPADTTITVTLVAAPGIDVTVTGGVANDAFGRAVLRIGVEVADGSAPSPGGDDLLINATALYRGRAPVSRAADDSGHQRLFYEVAPSGSPTRVSGLRTGVPLRVSLVDRLCTSGPGATVTLASSERLPLTLIAPDVFHVVNGTVTFPEGKRPAGTFVTISRAGGQDLMIPVDVDRTFRETGFFDVPVDLRVELAGLPPWTARGVPFKNGETGLLVTLKP